MILILKVLLVLQKILALMHLIHQLLAIDGGGGIDRLWSDNFNKFQPVLVVIIVVVRIDQALDPVLKIVHLFPTDSCLTSLESRACLGQKLFLLLLLQLQLFHFEFFLLFPSFLLQDSSLLFADSMAADHLDQDQDRVQDRNPCKDPLSLKITPNVDESVQYPEQTEKDSADQASPSHKTIRGRGG